MITVEELLDSKKPKYKYIPHVFKPMRGGKPVCIHCGLVALRNPFTQWSIDKGCMSEYHPDYKRKRGQTNAYVSK